MVSLKNETHNSNLEDYLDTYLKDKSRDCILYSEDGSKFSIHKEVLSQTSFLREILYSAKGGLISEIFSIWLKSPKKRVTTHYPKHCLKELYVPLVSLACILFVVGKKVESKAFKMVGSKSWFLVYILSSS